MIATNKILPIALVAALLGGSVGALVMHKSNTEPANTAAATQTATTTQPATTVPANNLAANPANSTDQSALTASNMTQDEQLAYRDGFNDGFNSAASPSGRTATSSTVVQRVAPARTVTRTRYVGSRGVASNRAYYDYSQPRGRSFWQKHRNKLTVAMGTGGGAILGGLIGGRRGAAIGALAGAGGSALYTYKLRNRNRRY